MLTIYYQETTMKLKLLIILFCFFSLNALSAEWYRILSQGSEEQMIAYKKNIVDSGAAFTNPRVVEYNGKVVLMTGPYSDERVAQIKQNAINKNLSLDQFTYFQLTSQPISLEQKANSLQQAKVDRNESISTSSKQQNISQTAPQTAKVADVGTYLAECRGKFIVYTINYIQLGKQDTADSLKYMTKLTDNLANKYVSSKQYYEQISAQEVERFAPIARQSAPMQAHAELDQCIKFVGDLKNRG